MKVITYLKENGVEALRQELGIVVKEYDDLLVLNYNQIESPKTHPIVMECRGLILDKSFNVVSRSFSRFFNLGEAPDTQQHLDWNKAVCHEKVDGSLIRIYNFEGHWYVATRGTAYAESACGFGESFYELVQKALELNEDEEFQKICNKLLSKEWTYIFELTSVENRVVKRYEGYTLHYLASRHNATGEYGDGYEFDAAIALGAVPVKTYKFNTAEECAETAKHLPDLEEGYVVYQDGVPVCKVKSPAYVCVHHIRGEGLTPKRIMQLVLINEQDEYLKYFPEDEKFFTPYLQGFEDLMFEVENTWLRTGGIKDQKEFALAIKDLPYSALLFQGRAKQEHPENLFHKQSESYKLKLLGSWVNA